MRIGKGRIKTTITTATTRPRTGTRTRARSTRTTRRTRPARTDVLVVIRGHAGYIVGVKRNVRGEKIRMVGGLVNRAYHASFNYVVRRHRGG